MSKVLDHLTVFLLLLSSSLLLLAEAADNETDRYALLSFKSFIHADPTGALSSWNHSLHHCHWKGVLCGRWHPDRVTALVLDSLQLAGYMSPSLTNLTLLQRLSLSNNQFVGTIPEELGQLSRLKFLNLTLNSLNGHIPSAIGNCSNLEVLDIENNKIQGTIPSDFGRLSKLTILSFYNNNLSGFIPPNLGNLTNLSTLDFGNNRLNGTIPASLGQLQYLSELLLEFNNLTGEIPHSIYNISTMVALSLPENQLEGTLPSDMCDVYTNLDVLQLYGNQLKGSIPTSIPNCSLLADIEINSNSFKGTIPSSIGSLKYLYFLKINDNQFEAKKPSDWSFLDALGNCTRLEKLDLGKNELQGILPSSIVNLSITMTHLEIPMNPFSGSIPAEIGRLTNLVDLSIYETHLEGTIPWEIGKLSNLHWLDLSKNMLSGEMPSTLGNLTSMNLLLLYDNSLEGRIPMQLGNMKALQSLSLSGNKLTNAIPKEIMNLTSLSSYINLADNYLNDTIPPEIGNLINLGIIVLSNNILTGEIPSSIGNCRVLEYLYLEGNLLQGTIPSSMSNLKGLQELDLSNNSLTGEIPNFLSTMDLSYLNISFNDFEGEVPTDGAFSNASEIDIRGNQKLCGGSPEMDLPKCSPNFSSKRLHLQKTLIIILSVAGGLLSLSIIIYLLVTWYRRKKTQHHLEPVTAVKSLFKNVSYNDLLRATNNFSLENLIGKGSFGAVYKANMLFEDVTTVSVKVLNLEQHGASKSFLSECEAFRIVRHRNLVKVLSVCSSTDHQGNEFKALVLEFMPNGSLEEWLHPNSASMNQNLRCLSLVQRINIAIDVANALDYLHEHGSDPIVHRDLKPSNVLLDDDMTAHVTDFGLARVLVRQDTMFSQSMATTSGVKGSIGYIPPEYGLGGQASPQGDIYSYGILLLEMFTGVSPIDERFTDGLSLYKQVEMSFPDRVFGIIDSRMFSSSEEGDNKYVQEIVHSCLVSVFQCGLLCAKESPRERIAIKEAINHLNSARAKLLVEADHQISGLRKMKRSGTLL